MATEEQDRCNQILEDYEQGERMAAKLEWHEPTQTIVEVGGSAPEGKRRRLDIPPMGFANA